MNHNLRQGSGVDFGVLFVGFLVLVKLLLLATIVWVVAHFLGKFW